MRCLIAMLLLVAAPARAGLTCDAEERELFMHALENEAKGTKDKFDDWWSGFDCGYLQHTTEAYQKRFFEACTGIVARRGADANAKSKCALVSLGAGKTTLGNVDLFTVVRESDVDPVDDEAPAYLAAMSADPRARAFILEHYRRYLARSGKKPPRGSYAGSWIKWQVSVLATLEKLATPEDRAFVDEVIAANKDKRVLEAAAKLAAVIDAKKD